mmetsp:Transcript_33711/g.86127  ORF Transcript_33711/g.86127 Transcript_33711/m.86127 type:complete len:241 (+) Transcript_33711:662-1384(+)
MPPRRHWAPAGYRTCRTQGGSRVCMVWSRTPSAWSRTPRSKNPLGSPCSQRYMRWHPALCRACRRRAPGSPGRHTRCEPGRPGLVCRWRCARRAQPLQGSNHCRWQRSHCCRSGRRCPHGSAGHTPWCSGRGGAAPTAPGTGRSILTQVHRAETRPQSLHTWPRRGWRRPRCHSAGTAGRTRACRPHTPAGGLAPQAQSRAHTATRQSPCIPHRRHLRPAGGLYRWRKQERIRRCTCNPF